MKFTTNDTVVALKNFDAGPDEIRVGKVEVFKNQEYRVLFTIEREGKNYVVIEAEKRDLKFSTPAGDLMFYGVSAIPEEIFDFKGNACTCDIMVLMQSGCQCGSIKRHGT